jgi:hypothetical protein
VISLFLFSTTLVFRDLGHKGHSQPSHIFLFSPSIFFLPPFRVFSLAFITFAWARLVIGGGIHTDKDGWMGGWENGTSLSGLPKGLLFFVGIRVGILFTVRLMILGRGLFPGGIFPWGHGLFVCLYVICNLHLTSFLLLLYLFSRID